jgi:hypothetical protein
MLWMTGVDNVTRSEITNAAKRRSGDDQAKSIMVMDGRGWGEYEEMGGVPELKLDVEGPSVEGWQWETKIDE